MGWRTHGVETTWGANHGVETTGWIPRGGNHEVETMETTGETMETTEEMMETMGINDRNNRVETTETMGEMMRWK